VKLKLDDDVAVAWTALFPVIKQRASMTEITSTLSLDDVDLLTRALEATLEAEAIASKGKP
jgi:glycine cleavage system protein P-like pyridoxal-binding family